MKKVLVGGLLLGLFVASVGANGVSLSSSTRFNVSVPMSIPVSLLSSGEVVTSSDLFIENSGSTPVSVSSILVLPCNGWDVVSYQDFNPAYEPVGERLFAISINDNLTTEDGALHYNNFIPDIQVGASVHINYDVKLPVSDLSYHEQVGTVVFTVDVSSEYASIQTSDYMLDNDSNVLTEYTILADASIKLN